MPDNQTIRHRQVPRNHPIDPSIIVMSPALDNLDGIVSLPECLCSPLFITSAYIMLTIAYIVNGHALSQYPGSATTAKKIRLTRVNTLMNRMPWPGYSRT